MVAPALRHPHLHGSFRISSLRWVTPMYQLEVKRYLVEHQFPPTDGWEVTVDVDAMERARAARAPQLVAGLQTQCVLKIIVLPTLWVLLERRMERSPGPFPAPALLNPKVWYR